MCGIVGFTSDKIEANKYSSILLEMLGMQLHRGPDEFGYYVDDIFALGNARLSIVDVKNGHQPMTDLSEKFWITYNGEIYNYLEIKSELQRLGAVFCTNSDTEVVLNAWIAWGINGISRLDGAFSFAIYDKEAKKVYLVRDRFGEKPLYFIYQNGSFIFSSEIKSFLKFPNFKFSFDVKNLYTLFLTWTGFGDSTIFEGIKQVSPGHYLEFSPNDGISMRKYDTFEDNLRNFAGSFRGTFKEAKEQTKLLISKSVKKRLSNEVKTAIYLSGGIDSAIIAKEASLHSTGQIHTFSVAFDSKAHDESADQLELSQYLGSKHHSVQISNDLISKYFAEAVWHAEIPLFRSAPIPMLILSKCVSELGFKVALTGEGADEIFLGYDIFKESIVRSKWNEALQIERHHAIENIYKYLEHFNKSNIKSIDNSFSRSSVNKSDILFSHLYRFNNSKISLRLFSDSQGAIIKAFENASLKLTSLNDMGLLQRAQCIEVETLLSGYLLSSQGDRMVMASSVEGRCPFLSKEIVSFANSLPIEFKLKDTYGEKHILKDTYRHLLPEFVINKSKKPYRSPDSIALMGEDTLGILEKFIAVASVHYKELFDIVFCQRLVDRVFSAGKRGVNIGPSEDSTFVLLTSIAYLYDFFINRNYPVNKTHYPPIVIAHHGYV